MTNLKMAGIVGLVVVSIGLMIFSAYTSFYTGGPSAPQSRSR